MLKRYSFYEKQLFIIFLVSLLIDNINGAIMLYSGVNLITFSQIIRLFFTIYFFVILIKTTPLKQLRYWIVFAIFLFSLPFFFFLSHRNMSGLYMDILYATKLLYPFLIVFAIQGLIKQKKVHRSLLTDLFQWYSVLAPLSLLIPKALGIGFDSYELGGGYKGFYYSNNEINVVLICTFLFSIHQFYQKQNWKNAIQTLINVIALFLIGSKTSLLVIAIVLVVYFIKFVKLRPPHLIFYLFGFVLFCFFASIVFWPLIVQMMNRMLFFYNRFMAEGYNFIDFMTSGRIQRVVPAIQKNILQNSDGLVHFFFGIGRYQQVSNFDLSTLMELDFYDTFHWYGIITTVVVLIGYLKMYVPSLFFRDYFVYQFMFVLVMIFSLIAGHVWFSALTGTMFALVCTMLVTAKEEEVK